MFDSVAWLLSVARLQCSDNSHEASSSTNGKFWTVSYGLRYRPYEDVKTSPRRVINGTIAKNDKKSPRKTRFVDNEPHSESYVKQLQALHESVACLSQMLTSA